MSENAASPAGSPPVSLREGLVRTVQTPLGYFVLVILVAEAILGALAGVSTGPDRTLAIWGVLGACAVLTAVVTTLAVTRPEALFGKRPPAAVTASPAGGLRLRPRWRSVRPVDGVEIRARWKFTHPGGEDVSAVVRAESGPYEGAKYNYRGTLRDRILTLEYAAADPHVPDRGTLTLKLSASGDVLDGYLAFYSTARDRVEVCPYRCEATG